MNYSAFCRVGVLAHRRTSGRRQRWASIPTLRESALAFIVSILLWAVTPPAQAADAPAQEAGLEWKVGVAQTKITPEFPVFMAGYDNRNKPFEKVTSDLYVKAMVLEDREGRRAVLVTSDLIGFPAAIAEPICDRIHAKTG